MIHKSNTMNGVNANGDTVTGSSPVGNGETNGLTIDTPPPDDQNRDAPSAMTRKRKIQEELVQRLIRDAESSGATTLDLSGKCLRRVPVPVLQLQNLQYLYMEGNELTSLPDNFFDCLPNLLWLDLRRNYLASLPSTYIGRHKHLRSLLLEGNELKTLPLELGLVTTLNGLNICHNPLEFPPVEVIERGTTAVLTFLRDLLKAKSQGKMPDGVPRVEDLSLHDTSDGDSSDSDSWVGGNSAGPQIGPSADMMRQRQYNRQNSRTSPQEPDLIGPVPQSAALHKPVTFNDMKQLKTEKWRQAGALGRVEGQNRTRKQKLRRTVSRDNNPYLDSLPLDKVERRYIEERRLAQLKEIKEQQDAVLQRRKDHDMLKEWRDEGKTLQREKLMEARMYGGSRSNVDIAKHAPFGVYDNHMKLPSNEERIKNDVKETHERMRRPMSPKSVAEAEKQRAARDMELGKRIRKHTTEMQSRRNLPEGNPQEEMEAARRELEVAEQLQREIDARRKELEYRFTAFTGDFYSSSGHKK